MRILFVLAIVLVAAPLFAAGGGGAPKDKTMPGAATPDSRYTDGVQRAKAQQWSEAEVAFRDATMQRPKFPEAWNGLGHALKMQGKYGEALKAYDEALRQRPDYPEAIEYLGEAYVGMGRPDDARTQLARLKPLDGKLADRLERTIAAGKPDPTW
jgi:cytochrome c-type biogenesis protein CcmH/NrfG